MTPLELRVRRGGLGLTQSALAGVLDVSQNTLSRWEVGARRIPDDLDARLTRIEDQLLDQVGSMVTSAQRTGHIEVPEGRDTTDLLAQVAAGRARLTLTPRPDIIPA